MYYGLGGKLAPPMMFAFAVYVVWTGGGGSPPFMFAFLVDFSDNADGCLKNKPPLALMVIY